MQLTPCQIVLSKMTNNKTREKDVQGDQLYFINLKKVISN